MYAFFTIFGFLFIVISSILTNYIYTVFSINKVTNFLYPTDGRNIIDEINITVLPIIVWGFVELPILGYNDNFIISILLNILVSCSIMYEIKYGFYLVLKKEIKFINIIAICLAAMLGQIVSYMILKSNPLIILNNIEYIVSIIGMIIILLLHSLIILKIPQIKKQKDKYEEKR